MANPKILYNQGKITLDRVSQAQWSLTLTPEERSLLSRYLNQTKTYLEKISSNCAKLIDDGKTNSTIIDNFLKKNGIENTNDAIIFQDKPSVFLNKAYTRQTFHEDNEKNQNRFQPYINAGLNFTECFDKSVLKMTKMTEDEKLFYDVGTMIAAINTVLSQIDRVISQLNQNEVNDDGVLAVMIPTLFPALEALSDEVKKSPIMETDFFSNLRNDLMEVLENVLNWIVNKLRFGSSNNEKNGISQESDPKEDQNKNRGFGLGS